MRIIVFHGWGSDSSSNWFPNLKEQFERKGKEVIVPSFPNSKNPRLEEWLKVTDELDIKEDDILIGHSLGSVLILHLLQTRKVKAAFLVSAFHVDLGVEEIRNFLEADFDFEEIKKNRLFILNSDDDPYIKTGIARELAGMIHAPLLMFHKKGHLSEGTDNFKFPELVAMVDELI